MKFNIATSSPGTGLGVAVVLRTFLDWPLAANRPAQADSNTNRNSKSTAKQPQSHWYDDPSALRGI